MCGISGLANWGDAETLARMTHVQSHRGPDDSGLWERRFPDRGYIGLGSRRLAILDLSPDGHMPMSKRWLGVDYLQRRNLQLRRSAPGLSRATAFARTLIPKQSFIFTKSTA
jgi:hypothetical protein